MATMDPQKREEWKAFVDEVRAAVRIEDVIGPLDKQRPTAGGAFIGCSPLRPDRTPSFMVSPEKGFWIDYGTQEQGDVFAFVMKRDGVDFKTALATLAAMGNVARPGGMGRPHVDDDEHDKIMKGMIERNRVQTVQTQIVEAMHDALPDRVRDFIRRNWHFTDETIDRYKFGWCPAGLAERLMASPTGPDEGYGMTEKDLLLSGFFAHVGGRPVPVFDHRIVFPYWHGPHVVYAIGRRFDPVPTSEILKREDGKEGAELAKYKKLLTHDKAKNPHVSEWVLNEHFLNEEVALKPGIDRLTITEGVTDCYALMQIGEPSMSPVTVGFRAQDIPKVTELARRIHRRGGKVYLMNDNDVLPNGRRPGYEGAMRTAKALSQAGIDVRIAWLPKPEGVAKIDVNEYVGAILEECHGRGLTEEESNAEARAAIHALQLNAKEMGIALLDALPDTLEGADLDKAIGELASAVAHTPELQRARCAATIAKRFKLPTATVRKIFKDAADVYAEEIAKAKKEEKPTLASLEGGSMPIRGAVSEAPDHYFTTLKIMRGDEAVDVAQPVSDFRLAPRRVLLPEKGQELLDVEVIGLGGEARGRYVIPAEAWTSARAFKTARPSAHLVWSGNDNELANVQGLLFAEEGVPRVRCTRVLGYHETPDGPRWVTPQGTLGPFGFLDAPDIVFVDERGSNELAARMRWEDVEPILVEKLAAEALPALLTVAPEEVILPILGHLYASAFAPRVRGLVGAFPLLNVSGTAGSGKTSLMRVLWRLQGIAPERSEAFGPGTPFTLSQPLAWTNTTWIFNDEFRHDLGPKMIEAYERLARLAYVGDMQMRGRADLSMSTTLLIAPWAISGEVVASGDDPALRERFVPVHPDKMWIKDHPESSEAFARLREMPLHHLAPSFAVWSLKQDARALLAKADKLVGMALVEIGARDVAIRVRNNVTTIVLGLVALDEWAASLGVVLKMSIVKAVRRVLESIIGVEDGGIIDSSKSKDAFDVFFELAATYAAMGDLKEGVHYRFSEGKLVLGLKATYFAVREAMVRGGADRAFSLDYGALRAAVRDKLRAGGGYLLPESIEENGGKRRFGKRVVIGSTVHAAVVIDLRLVPENVEAVDFPTTRASTTRDMLASFVRGEIPPPPWGPKTGDS